MGLSTFAYLVIGVLVVITAVLLLRSRSGKAAGKTASTPAKSQSATVKTTAATKHKPAASKSPAPSNTPYRAISIVPGSKACEAAIAIGEKRFLAAAQEIPQLPLPGCRQPRCTCRYAHHADRRDTTEGDRRGPPGLRSELHTHTGESERRAKKRGRRASDWE